MKKILAIALSVITYACAFGQEPEDPEFAYVDFWYEFEIGGTNTFTYSDGSTFTFYIGHFIEKRMKLSDAANDFYSAYSELKAGMEGLPKVKAAQVTYNMSIWTEVMTAAMIKGIAEQRTKDAARIGEAAEAIESSGEAVAALTESTSSALALTERTLIGQLASIQQSVGTQISQLSAYAQESEESLNSKIKDLQSAIKNDATAGEIATLQSQVAQFATDIASCKKAIEEAKKSESESVEQGVQYVLRTDYTNLVKRISAFLGNANDKHGSFVRPLNPITGEKYGDDASVVNYLSDLGVVAYADANLIASNIIAASKFNHRFYDSVFNGRTNVMANFEAPYSWADGSTITVTNGKFSAGTTTKILNNMTNLVLNAGGITNTFFSENGVLAKVLGQYWNYDAESGELTGPFTAEGGYQGGVTNLLYGASGITNMFTSVVNLQKNFDLKSVGTNDENKIEVVGFKSAPNSDEYDFYPTRRWTEGAGPRIEWDTNTLSVIQQSFYGRMDAPPKSVSARGPNAIAQWYVGKEGFKDGLLGLYVDTTNTPMSKLNSNRMLDIASVWTNGNGRIEMRGFNDESAIGNVPVVREAGGIKHIAWEPMGGVTADSDAMVNIIGSEVVKHRSIENKSGWLYPTNNVFSLYGFSEAAEGTVPHVRTYEGMQSKSLSWETPSSGGGGGAMKFVGTDNSTAVAGSGSVTNEVHFASESDSNVSVKISKANEIVTITLGVYYK